MADKSAQAKRARRRKNKAPGRKNPTMDSLGQSLRQTRCGVDRQQRYGALLLLVALLLSYLPVTQAGFIWDDFIIVTSKAVSAWSGLWQLWFDPFNTYTPENTYEDHYWPLLYTSFWLEHKLWGFAPLGYHLVNIGLHICNTALFWRILQRLGLPGAGFAAALFALHPAHVEAVAWIMGRKDLLAALFYFAAALTWLRYVETRQLRPYLLTALLFTAAMLCKTIALTLPAALLLLHWWRQPRLSGLDVMRLAPLFLIAAGIALADLWFLTNRREIAYDYSVPERVLIAAQALWFYVGKLVWPTGLATIQPRWDVDIAGLRDWLYLLGLLIVMLSLWMGRHRTGRGMLVGVLFFILTLAPVLCLIDHSWMQFTFVADRYQYLASAGLLALAGAGAAGMMTRWPGGGRKATAAAAAILLLTLGGMTWQQAGVYRDELTFFRHQADINPQERAVQLHLGKALFERAQRNTGHAATHAALMAQAEQHYLQALQLDPDYTAAWQNLAELYRLQQRHTEAIAAYRTALEQQPDYDLALAGLGVTLLALQRDAEAIEVLRRALDLKPTADNAPVLLVLMGKAAQRLTRPAEAAAHFTAALRLQPNNIEAREQLALLHFEQQQYQQALLHFQQLARLQPGQARTHVNIGATLLQQGRGSAALRSFERALELEPDNKPARQGRDQSMSLL